MDTGAYEVTVADTGMGIPKADLPFIFDRFRKSNLEGDVGYGLGLAIVKSIVMYHQLKISVQSEIGEGTTFKIIFPKNDIVVNAKT